ncbi:MULTISPECIES: hypothetical protein [unclassified Coleofasciculus]|uniref:hypothetical protein n=1 Tax=unclassified Coleofasciculus TaxID=2692782 RepID=UPI00187E0C06|nr:MULTISPECIES: hypothetical protein [unclassified Coleofasciculus]MBE9130242.1 hypothetical protein [Coleofasciculus sp. LEGE 07081]MBE9152542.1 hypothetical protein [Coleofasciculus sp. LEGE 07092]
MTINYPIIETQLRLIRALQRGYAEALEAGDWQAADYRCTHLQKLCEGLHHLSYLLDRDNTLSTAVTPKTANSWVGTIRSSNPIHSLAQAPETNDKPISSRPIPPEPPPIDEVWNQ